MKELLEADTYDTIQYSQLRSDL